jgi:hypothetical protein
LIDSWEFPRKSREVLQLRVFAMREDELFDIAYEPIGILYPTGFIRLAFKAPAKTTKTP